MEETPPCLCHGLYSLLLSFTVAAPLPCQPVFTIKIRSIYRYLSCFFIKQCKSPDVGLVFASKGENQKQTREMPCSRGRDCMSEHGLKLKRLCSMFIPLHCNYPTTALILAAKNNITRIYMKSVKIALPLERMLCLTWFFSASGRSIALRARYQNSNSKPCTWWQRTCCHKDIISNPIGIVTLNNLNHRNQI